MENNKDLLVWQKSHQTVVLFKDKDEKLREILAMLVSLIKRIQESYKFINL